MAMTGWAGFDKILNVPVNVWPPHIAMSNVLHLVHYRVVTVQILQY